MMVGGEMSIGQKSNTKADEQDLLPFAAEIGRAAWFDGGFAAGVVHQEGSGTRNAIVTLSEDGATSKLIALGASHGDADPPVVFARGRDLGAAVLEPTGASRSLRIARIEGDTVHWAAELRQGLDESLAFDVALGEERGVIAWDDLPKDRDVSAVMVSTFKREGFESPTAARPVTMPGVDADSPRLVERAGGFWLFWVARRSADGEYDARYRAEEISFRWIEVAPLDASGALAGSPRRIGANTGHVLAYDVSALSGTEVAVAWRDDDTPSGSIGGQLFTAVVRQGGIDGPDAVDDAHSGVGAPLLMPGWIAIADATGPTRLAPLGLDGKLLDILRSEELLGMGEPLVNHGDTMLVARPAGLAVRLFVARCGRERFDAGTPDAGEDDD